MEGGCAPVRIESLQLYNQKCGPSPAADRVWGTLKCSRVLFSPCGTWMALVISGEQPSLTQEADVRRVREVALHHATHGFQLQARFYTGMLQPHIAWSPSGHWCIAQLPGCQGEPDEKLPMQSAAFVWDPKAGELVHSLERKTSLDLCKLGAGSRMYAHWSPSCRYLLVHGCHAHSSQTTGTRPGWLSIADLEQGRLIVQSALVSKPDFWRLPIRIEWHPSSQGLIFEGHTHIEDASVFAAAGFAIGKLAEPLRLHRVGFSTDAEHLIAQHQRRGTSPIVSVVVHCSLEGQQICLVESEALLELKPHESLDVVGWLPGTTALFMQHQFPLRQFSNIVKVIGAPVEAYSLASRLHFDTISPSGRMHLMTSRAQKDLRFWLVEVSSHCKCFDSFKVGPPWYKGRCEEYLEPECGRPPGYAQHGLVCHGWVPTGLGLACTTYKPASLDGPQPPTLHFYWFA